MENRLKSLTARSPEPAPSSKLNRGWRIDCAAPGNAHSMMMSNRLRRISLVWTLSTALVPFVLLDAMNLAGAQSQAELSLIFDNPGTQGDSNDKWFKDGNGTARPQTGAVPPEERTVFINADKPGSASEARVSLMAFDGHDAHEGDFYINKEISTLTTMGRWRSSGRKSRTASQRYTPRPT
jgi:hypothetical protein